MKILLIEDDLILNQNISEMLQSEGMQVTSTFDGKLSEKFLQRDEYDCVIMDVNLPGKNGFELCTFYRLFNTHTPVILLTAFGELEDKVKGYQSGADDYLTKPFYMRELLLRVQALQKRSVQLQNQQFTFTVDDLVLDSKSKKVTRQGKEIILTPREYQILLKLIQNKNEVVAKKELIQDIWGYAVGVNTNTIEVYINFLRNKVDKPFNKNNIKTKVGYGYYFEI